MDIRIAFGKPEGKADGVNVPEGSSPVAANKAVIQRVEVPPCQLLVSDT